LRHEVGGQRIQRIPDNERRGRVHSSTVTVAVLGQGDHRQGPWQQREESDFKLEWFSGQGAGGQHRNKHQNSARLVHLPTGTVRCAQTRSRANSYAEAKMAMDVELDMLSGRALAEGSNRARREQIGKGERSDRQRVWRFQHDRVLDLRTGREIRCSAAMRGQIDGLWEGA
jgi:peptide chain release factor 1